MDGQRLLEMFKDLGSLIGVSVENLNRMAVQPGFFSGSPSGCVLCGRVLMRIQRLNALDQFIRDVCGRWGNVFRTLRASSGDVPELIEIYITCSLIFGGDNRKIPARLEFSGVDGGLSAVFYRSEESFSGPGFDLTDCR